MNSRELPRSVLSALAVAIVGTVASLALWRAVESRQSAEIERNSAAFASLLAKLLQVRIDEHELGALRRWVAFAEQESIDSALWRADARRFLSENPAYAAIVRIDRGRQSDVAHASESGAPVLELVEQLEQLPVTGPDAVLVGLPDGRAALAVPIPFRGGNTQLVFALLEPDVALRGILDEGAMGYSVRVVHGSDDLADAARDPMRPASDRFWASQSVVLSTGTALTVRVRPTARLAGSMSNEGPAFVLYAGLAISALAAALVHACWPGRRRATAAAIATGEAWGRAEPGLHDDPTSPVPRSQGTRESERTLALQQTVLQLEQMNMSVSHDLRTPIGAVINFATILSSKYANVLDAPAIEYLQRISSNAKRAVTLMDDLLEFSRSGREEIHKARVDMRRLVESVCDDLIGSADRGSLEIADLPAAYADPEMMRRVFTNLISNAWKFVAAGASPRVTIGGERKAGEVVYFVRDQGVGFDTHSVDRLFNEFGRLHASAFEGHGIGLTIVARLVRRHGGRVWAHGAEGSGATFLFSLPLPPPGSLDLDTREVRDEDRIEAVSGLVAPDLPGSEEIGSGFDPSRLGTFPMKENARC